MRHLDTLFAANLTSLIKIRISVTHKYTTMKKTERQMWVCSECGSIHVQAMLWVNLNGSSIDWDSSADLDKYYCQDCEHTGVELRVIKCINGSVRVQGYQVESINEHPHPAMSDSNSLYSLEDANEMALILGTLPDGKICRDWYIKAYYKGDIEDPVLMFSGKDPRKPVLIKND